MKLLIGCDHAGYELVEKLIPLLEQEKHQLELVGTFSKEQSVDYPDFAHLVCNHLLAKEADCGILVCGTGIGMAIAANKIKGIRAANVADCYSAKMCRAHNDANVLCLGSRVIGLNLALEIIKVFLATSYEGGRHQRRIDKYE
jgi:ribose 5-phosphate isomerase B